MPKPRVCAFCKNQGHNVRACPRLALKLLRAVNKKHSPKQVVQAVSRGKVSVVNASTKSRGSSMRHGGKRVAQKGTRASSGARQITSRTSKRKANERRRTQRRQTKDDHKILKQSRANIAGAWKTLISWNLVRQGRRGSFNSYDCTCSRDGCVANLLNIGRPHTVKRKRAEAWLAQRNRKLKTMYFVGNKCCSVHLDVI